MAKNDHMLAILWMLNSGRKITAAQIAEKLEISVRTVYRYIDSLCASGVPVVSEAGQNGGYSLLDQFIDAPLIFDLEEQKALLRAAAFANEAGHPFSEDLDSATKKLKLYSNQEQQSILNRSAAGFEVINREVPADLKTVLEQLEQSVTGEYSVEIEYRSKSEDEARVRVIDPYGVIYWNGKWYTIGFCHLRNDIRSFRVERISRINRTGQQFKRPEAFSAREYFLQKLLPVPGGDTALIPLVIKGRAEALDDLCTHWFMGHHLHERTSNQAVFLIDEKFLHEYVPYFLLPYGKSIQVIEPLSCRQRQAAIALELAAYYQSEQHP